MDKTITAGGDYNTTLTSDAGCDSLATLHLSITPVVTGEETVTICEGQLPYTWNNQSIIATGHYNNYIAKYCRLRFCCDAASYR
jgi:hypothetical protein